MGERLIQTDLARTLKAIANQGPTAFYQGETARQIVTASQANGGIFTPVDLAQYSAIESAPLRCTYRDYPVLTAPLPGGGTTLCQMLQILEAVAIATLGRNTSETLQPALSAMAMAFCDRNQYLGDPRFTPDRSADLLDPNYIRTLQNCLADPALSPPTMPHPQWFPAPASCSTTK